MNIILEERLRPLYKPYAIWLMNVDVLIDHCRLFEDFPWHWPMNESWKFEGAHPAMGLNPLMGFDSD